VEACLRSKGARIARSPDELDFLRRAEARGQAFDQGFFHDDVADLLVDTLGRGKIGGELPKWYVWFGYPTPKNGERAPTPFQILESRPSKNFVAYIVRPSDRQREALKSCFGLDSK
jgi:hypothetical protein